MWRAGKKERPHLLSLINLNANDTHRFLISPYLHPSPFSLLQRRSSFIICVNYFFFSFLLSMSSVFKVTSTRWPPVVKTDAVAAEKPLPAGVLLNVFSLLHEKRTNTLIKGGDKGR